MVPPPDLSVLDHAAKDALILSLIGMVERLEAKVADLERRLGLPPKTPLNSSVPPSRGSKPSDPAITGRKPGGKAHDGVARELAENPAALREERLAACPSCGAALGEAAQEPWLAYDHVELPPAVPVVTRVTLMRGACPCCARRFKAAAPADMPAGSPFGPELTALALHLRFTQGVGFKRLQALLADGFGVRLSQGALVNMMDRAAPAFAAQALRIGADLKAGKVIESDETGMRVAKANRWFWVFHHGPSALVTAAAGRGKAEVEAFLGGWRPDWWLSDRYGAQMGWAAKGHQVCLAHLDRDLRYAAECGETVYAEKLRGLLRRACRIGRKRPRLAGATLKAGTPPARRGPRRDSQTPAGLHHRQKASAADQAPPAALLRLPRTPGAGAHQQRLGTQHQAVRDIPQNHRRLPHRKRREALRRRPFHPRNRPPPRHHPAQRHPVDPPRHPAPQNGVTMRGGG